MEIYTVKQGDTLQAIADRFNISVQRLARDNDLYEGDRLIPGQNLIIAYPQQEYTVKEGDTLIDIANQFKNSIIQLLMNNPFLADRMYIYPGEKIIISFDTNKGKIVTHGNTIPTINETVLRKTLPFLSYLSVFNYTVTEEGNIISYYDDTKVIEISKAYGVAPLMLLTSLTTKGETHIETSYNILISEDFQNRIIENILNILRTKGYYGVNINFENVNVSNINLYETYFTKIATRLNEEGYPVFLTSNPNLSTIENETAFERVDYSTLNQLAQNIIFMSYEWAARDITPSPISSYYLTDSFLNFILNYIPSDKVIIGIATIGYDWELPYAPRISNVNSLSFGRAVQLAREVEAVIQFDELSQTPYFTYTLNNVEHIVRYINSRTIIATLNLVSKYNLRGISVWNIMIFNPQLWLIISSQYEIEKFYPLPS